MVKQFENYLVVIKNNIVKYDDLKMNYKEYVYIKIEIVYI